MKHTLAQKEYYEFMKYNNCFKKIL